MKNKNGFTLVELLVSIVVSSILMLIIGGIVGISSNSSRKLTNKIQVFTDLASGFKLAQNRIHEAAALTNIAQTGNWLSNKLVINNTQAIGVYQASAGANKEFVYLEDVTDETTRKALFSVNSSEAINLDLTLSGASVTLRVYGTKGNYPFDITTTCVRRS